MAGDTSGARTVQNWFETLPFHRGISLLGIAVLIPAVVIGGTVLLTGGSKNTVAKPPGRPHATVAAPGHTWGTYVPPRKVVPTPARTQHGSLILLRPTPTTVAKPRPSRTTASCPADWKRWRWLWDICRRTSDNTGP